MKDVLKVKKLKRLLKQIAEHNQDEWETNIKLDEHAYVITVTETADRHDLTGVAGVTLDDAIKALGKELPWALKSWGYSMPDFDLKARLNECCLE